MEILGGFLEFESGQLLTGVRQRRKFAADLNVRTPLQYFKILGVRFVNAAEVPGPGRDLRVGLAPAGMRLHQHQRLDVDVRTGEDLALRLYWIGGYPVSEMDRKSKAQRPSFQASWLSSAMARQVAATAPSSSRKASRRSSGSARRISCCKSRAMARSWP
jgi:hypothetical protein